METLIKCDSRTIKSYVQDAGQRRSCILFLSGGNAALGRERYNDWQRRLKLSDISSVSFDYSDIYNSSATSKGSLEKRIEEGVCVADWVSNHMHAKQCILYGVSMGGYIALGLASKKPDVFKKLVLHAPAAYSSKAHNLAFDESFTKELRKENSWDDSLSFKWMKQFDKPILFIEAGKDETIPTQITERYKEIKRGVGNFKVFRLDEAHHNIWGGDPKDAGFRDKIFEALISFVE